MNKWSYTRVNHDFSHIGNSILGSSFAVFVGFDLFRIEVINKRRDGSSCTRSTLFEPLLTFVRLSVRAVLEPKD